MPETSGTKFGGGSTSTTTKSTNNPTGGSLSAPSRTAPSTSLGGSSSVSRISGGTAGSNATNYANRSGTTTSNTGSSSVSRISGGTAGSNATNYANRTGTSTSNSGSSSVSRISGGTAGSNATNYANRSGTGTSTSNSRPSTPMSSQGSSFKSPTDARNSNALASFNNRYGPASSVNVPSPQQVRNDALARAAATRALNAPQTVADPRTGFVSNNQMKGNLPAQAQPQQPQQASYNPLSSVQAPRAPAAAVQPGASYQNPQGVPQAVSDALAARGFNPDGTKMTPTQSMAAQYGMYRSPPSVAPVAAAPIGGPLGTYADPRDFAAQQPSSLGITPASVPAIAPAAQIGPGMTAGNPMDMSRANMAQTLQAYQQQKEAVTGAIQRGALAAAVPQDPALRGLNEQAMRNYAPAVGPGGMVGGMVYNRPDLAPAPAAPAAPINNASYFGDIKQPALAGWNSVFQREWADPVRDAFSGLVDTIAGPPTAPATKYSEPIGPQMPAATFGQLRAINTPDYGIDPSIPGRLQALNQISVPPSMLDNTLPGTSYQYSDTLPGDSPVPGGRYTDPNPADPGPTWGQAFSDAAGWVTNGLSKFAENTFAGPLGSAINAVADVGIPAGAAVSGPYGIEQSPALPSSVADNYASLVRAMSPYTTGDIAMRNVISAPLPSYDYGNELERGLIAQGLDSARQSVRTVATTPQGKLYTDRVPQTPTTPSGAPPAKTRGVTAADLGVVPDEAIPGFGVDQSDIPRINSLNRIQPAAAIIDRIGAVENKYASPIGPAQGIARMPTSVADPAERVLGVENVPTVGQGTLGTVHPGNWMTNPTIYSRQDFARQAMAAEQAAAEKAAAETLGDPVRFSNAAIPYYRGAFNDTTTYEALNGFGRVVSPLGYARNQDEYAQFSPPAPTPKARPADYKDAYSIIQAGDTVPRDENGNPYGPETPDEDSIGGDIPSERSVSPVYGEDGDVQFPDPSDTKAWKVGTGIAGGVVPGANFAFSGLNKLMEARWEKMTPDERRDLIDQWNREREVSIRRNEPYGVGSGSGSGRSSGDSYSNLADLLFSGGYGGSSVGGRRSSGKDGEEGGEDRRSDAVDVIAPPSTLSPLAREYLGPVDPYSYGFGAERDFYKYG